MRNKKKLIKEEGIETYQQKKNKLAQLASYDYNYNPDKFISDLVGYFDAEVDFDLVKIRQTITEPGKLNQLIKKAKQKNTHPVTEFVQELFLNLAS